jgi:hypothetical protein
VSHDETRVLTVLALSADSSNMAHDVEIGAGGPHSAPRAFGVEMQGNGDRIGNFSGIGVESVECCDLDIGINTGEERFSESTPVRTPRNSRGRGGESETHFYGLSTSSWRMFGMSAVRRYARLLEPNYLSFKSPAVEVGTRSLTILSLQLPTVGMARFPLPNLLRILLFRHRPWLQSVCSVCSSPLAPLCAGGIQVTLVEKKLAFLRLRVLGSAHLDQLQNCLELVLPGVWQGILSIDHCQGLSSGIRNSRGEHVYVFWRGVYLINLLRLPVWA